MLRDLIGAIHASMAIGKECPHQVPSADRGVERLLHPLEIKGGEKGDGLVKRPFNANALGTPQPVVELLLVCRTGTGKSTLDLGAEAVALVSINEIVREVFFQHIQKPAFPNLPVIVVCANTRPKQLHNDASGARHALLANGVVALVSTIQTLLMDDGAAALLLCAIYKHNAIRRPFQLLIDGLCPRGCLTFRHGEVAGVKEVAPFVPNESKKQVDDPVCVCVCVQWW